MGFAQYAKLKKPMNFVVAIENNDFFVVANIVILCYI